jgi:hypothetical protein
MTRATKYVAPDVHQATTVPARAIACCSPPSVAYPVPATRSVHGRGAVSRRFPTAGYRKTLLRAGGLASTSTTPRDMVCPQHP